MKFNIVNTFPLVILVSFGGLSQRYSLQYLFLFDICMDNNINKWKTFSGPGSQNNRKNAYIYKHNCIRPTTDLSKRSISKNA